MELNFKIKDKSDKSLNIREANLSTFKKKGFPNKREEDWKFTDLEKIILPFLYNLQKSDEPYIHWPNRGPIIKAQIEKILKLTRN